MNDECPLCNLEKITRWYYADAMMVICDCDVCGVPMGVLRRHTMQPTLEEETRLMSTLVAMFPKRKLDTVQRSIPDHLHYHMR